MYDAKREVLPKGGPGKVSDKVVETHISTEKHKEQNMKNKKNKKK